MSLLAVGTVAFDSIETPFETRRDVLGGSVTHFASAARLFGPVEVVAVVGTDFPAATMQRLAALGIGVRGIEVAQGKTFRWSGRYEADWNTRHTLDTQLNVFEDRKSTRLNSSHSQSSYADFCLPKKVAAAPKAGPANRLSPQTARPARPALNKPAKCRASPRLARRSSISGATFFF